jgi:hypothetical protein
LIKFGQDPDPYVRLNPYPDPHSPKRLDPDQHKVGVTLKQISSHTHRHIWIGMHMYTEDSINFISLLYIYKSILLV